MFLRDAVAINIVAIILIKSYKFFLNKTPVYLSATSLIFLDMAMLNILKTAALLEKVGVSIAASVNIANISGKYFDHYV